MSFQIEQQDNDTYIMRLGCGRVYVVHAKDLEEMRNYFQQERDTKLGRWRDPENPDFVVYPLDSYSTVRRRCAIVDETTGSRHYWDGTEVVSSICMRVATNYFRTHPEPKPWHEAKPGEIWDVTTKNTLGTVKTQRCQVIRNLRFLPFMERSGFQNPSIDLKNTQIQAATRVLDAFEADSED